MKVTFCTLDGANYVGGPGAWLLRLLPELERRGLQVRVLLLTMSPGGTLACALDELRIGYAETRYFHFTEDNVRWIIAQLANDPPDVFVPNFLIAALYASRWIKAAGIPTVAVLHSDDKFYRAILSQFVFGFGQYQVSALACVSRFLMQAVAGGASSPVLSRCLPCGAPLPTQTATAPIETLCLVYVGRLEEEQKRISDVTKALCNAVREVPGTEAIIYGEGAGRAAVERILQEQGRGLPIVLGGRLESDQVQSHVLKCHALVLLSDYEGLPISLMEAMACGVVPICLDIRSGIPELVEHDTTGLLVKDRQEDFVKAVRRLREEPSLWQHLSDGSRQKIEEEYSSHVCAERWEGFLRETSRTSKLNQPLVVSKKIDLPPVQPDFAHEDNRRPSVPKLVLLRARQAVSRLKHRRHCITGS